MFNYGPYYSIINYYHLEWIILHNSFPKHRNTQGRPQYHNLSHLPRPSVNLHWLRIFSQNEIEPQGRFPCTVPVVLHYASTHGWKVLRFYTLQTKPVQHQAGELIQFPKAFWGTSEMKREFSTQHNGCPVWHLHLFFNQPNSCPEPAKFQAMCKCTWNIKGGT